MALRPDELTVWKFSLPNYDSILKMPRGAVVLSAAKQGDDICIWALVDPKLEVEDRKFSAIGTGHPVPFDAKFVDTIHTHDYLGFNLVWHIFEVHMD